MNLDQHFTPDDTAFELARSIVTRFDPYRQRPYIEPSVGDGAFVRGLMAAGISRGQITTVDLDESLEADVYSDFLEYHPDYDPATIIVGNPPFGRAGGLAHKFVEHALTLGDVVCYVMPLSSVNKPHCLSASLDGVEFSGTKTRCVWLEYYNNSLKKYLTTRPKRDIVGYKHVGKDDNYDIVIQRAGMRVAQPTQCNNSGEGKYYIKADNPQTLDALQHAHEYIDFVPSIKETSNQLSVSKYEFLDLVTLAFYERQNNEL